MYNWSKIHGKQTFISNATKKSMLLLITMGKTFHVTLVTWFIYLHVVLVTFNMWKKRLYHYINVLISTKNRNLTGNIKLFRNNCVGSSFSIQILEIFKSDGYVNRKKTRKGRPPDKNIENQISIWSQW